MPIYTATNRRQDGDPFPAILAIGDSWFWYPAFSNIPEEWLRHPQVKDAYKAIQLLGYNGARISQYVGDGKFAPALQAELQPDNLQYYSAFMISGGGNDAVRFDLAIRDNCQGITDPAQCLDPLKLNKLLGDVAAALGRLIHDILWAVQRDMQAGRRNNDVDIFFHGYDYAIPDGRGFGPNQQVEFGGPWLQPAFDHAGADSSLAFRSQVCRLAMDHLNTTLATFDGAGNGRVHFVRSTGTLISDLTDRRYQQDWANEMHPTRQGFAKIFNQAWLPVLQRHGYARKTGA